MGGTMNEVSKYDGFVTLHQPCPCGDSSNAYSINADNSGKCFSCNKFFRSKDSVGVSMAEDQLEEYTSDDHHEEDVVTMEYVSHWGISRKTFEFYGVYTKVVNGLPVSVGFPYDVNGDTTYKIRSYPFHPKVFFASDGPLMRKATLFGKDKFARGSKDKVLITEGEKDALAAYEMLVGQAAVVSARGGSSALADVKAERDYLNSFPKIILALDNDKVGQEATKQIIRSGLFDYNKLFKAW